ncbi:hypothetical protein JGS22_019715 [Streptomyces sp. P38-E01]|uniref:Transferase n=1 Tax=Streptomyces tardus TaxID=2780544 RepID=A0A949JJE9_9ACTN|nr:hypothetical protein [Streptomyces tardus]MBU7599790.1 hypothetical protein [Streptomyces tardus]
MTTAARRSVPGPRPTAGAPVAECTADTAGGLTFDIALGGRKERWDAALLLHGAQDGADPVRLPLVPAGAGVLRAVLPSTMRLAEGRWRASLVLGDRAPRRLRSGTHDLRSLVARVPRSGRTWLGVRIPYRTQGGGLSVRSWHRWPHAEASELRVEDGGMTVRGRLHGAEFTDGARLEVRTRDSGEVALGVPLVRDEHSFTARLPLGALAEQPQESGWLLWLRPGGDTPAVRVARILDDLVDKRHAVRYPAVPLLSGTQGVRPCYTGDNDLAIRWESRPPAGDLRTGGSTLPG